MSGRFLKVTVGDELEYRNLSHWLEQTGVEFKSFMLKQDRPIKVVIRGLPSNTEPEDIKSEIEAEGFKVAKISQMKNYRTKAPMPLFYLQIENGAEALKIYDFTELFGTRIEVKPFERGNKVNQCWRCQGWFHSSEVCHLPPRCVKCAGPHSAKDCTLDFNDPMKCANCSDEQRCMQIKSVAKEIKIFSIRKDYVAKMLEVEESDPSKYKETKVTLETELKSLEEKIAILEGKMTDYLPCPIALCFHNNKSKAVKRTADPVIRPAKFTAKATQNQNKNNNSKVNNKNKSKIDADFVFPTKTTKTAPAKEIEKVPTNNTFAALNTANEDDEDVSPPKYKMKPIFMRMIDSYNLILQEIH
ncbi:nucleic-acid-binding protein from transposon X-element [Trichonephila clavipes]|nr:nucleic-acid-binding protein from transposon X-element [Trichonephila clavipes]